jgi:hypothetical protein
MRRCRAPYKFGVRDAEPKSTGRKGRPAKVAPNVEAASVGVGGAARKGPKAPKPTASKADAPKQSPTPAPQGADDKGFRGRKSKLDAYAHLLGSVADSEVARIAGVTQENVRTYRMRRGIVPSKTAAQPAPAPKAAPKAPPVRSAPAPVVTGAKPVASSTPRTVYLVQLDTAQGPRSYALLANDIGEAAASALGRAQARHPKATITAIQLVADLL